MVRLESTTAPAQEWEAFDARNVLSQLEGMLSSYRGGQSILVGHIKDRLIRPPAHSRMTEGIGQQILNGVSANTSLATRSRSHQSESGEGFSLNEQSHPGEDHDMAFSSTSVSQSGNIASPDYSQLRQQQFMSYPWDDPTGSTADGFFNGRQH